MHMGLGFVNVGHAVAGAAHRTLAGIPGRQRRVDAAEAAHQVGQHAGAGVDVDARLDQPRGLGPRCIAAGGLGRDLHQAQRPARRHGALLVAGLDRDDGLQQFGIDAGLFGRLAHPGLHGFHLRGDVQPGQQGRAGVDLARHPLGARTAEHRAVARVDLAGREMGHPLRVDKAPELGTHRQCQRQQQHQDQPALHRASWPSATRAWYSRSSRDITISES
mmetsp:Transcript_57652/g.135685  ORF Transcript_57652/g.135685 Transcript_57652/m.135685 type:complete len:219 (+) Transcript_57652:3153-3809(+)